MASLLKKIGKGLGISPTEITRVLGGRVEEVKRRDEVLCPPIFKFGVPSSLRNIPIRNLELRLRLETEEGERAVRLFTFGLPEVVQEIEEEVRSAVEKGEAQIERYDGLLRKGDYLRVGERLYCIESTSEL